MCSENVVVGKINSLGGNVFGFVFGSGTYDLTKTNDPKLYRVKCDITVTEAFSVLPGETAALFLRVLNDDMMAYEVRQGQGTSARVLGDVGFTVKLVTTEGA
jgi:hypothetical protein